MTSPPIFSQGVSYAQGPDPVVAGGFLRDYSPPDPRPSVLEPGRGGRIWISSRPGHRAKGGWLLFRKLLVPPICHDLTLTYRR